MTCTLYTVFIISFIKVQKTSGRKCSTIGLQGEEFWGINTNLSFALEHFYGIGAFFLNKKYDLLFGLNVYNKDFNYYESIVGSEIFKPNKLILISYPVALCPSYPLMFSC